MKLPAGIPPPEGCRRDFSFRPLTGAVELALAEASEAGLSRPALVTAILAAALEQVGGISAEPETVAGLSVGDRQFLMRRLAILLGRSDSWLTTRCAGCGVQFDFSIDQALLPVKEAQQGFPYARVTTSRGEERFRVPSGADQELLVDQEDEEQAGRLLARLCLAPLPGATDPAAALAGPDFTPADIILIEEALETVAPEVASAVQAACPACGKAHIVEVDACAPLAGATSGRLLQEVHRLASAYHWSEADILALPTGRRRRYLELIDQARGLAC